MLTVEDDEFWEGVSPVEFGSLPALQDAVTVVGYPIGGDTISVYLSAACCLINFLQHALCGKVIIDISVTVEAILVLYILLPMFLISPLSACQVSQD